MRSLGLWVQARDEEDNRRLAGGDDFVVELEGPSRVHGHVTDNQDGTYEASYCVFAAGEYSLNLYTGGTSSCSNDFQFWGVSPQALHLQMHHRCPARLLNHTIQFGVAVWCEGMNIMKYQ